MDQYVCALVKDITMNSHLDESHEQVILSDVSIVHGLLDLLRLGEELEGCVAINKSRVSFSARPRKQV